MKSNHRKTPLERINEHLETYDDASWYAERLDLLGRIMFPDHWKSKEAREEEEQKND